ncbi:MAG: tetratricopeptide repeat protein, partial [Nitrospinaceae bacterium]|nr:tetratricopeptide repeat protein [Nitrospinaceae bacterium]
AYRKVLILGVTLFWGLALFVQITEARYPEMDITLWDEHQAKDDRKNPDYIKFHELVGQKNYDEALRLVDQIIQKTPHKGTPLILKALLLSELKQHRKAYLVLQKGRKIQRRHPAMQYANCRIYRDLGNVELSDRACKIVVHQHPKSRDAHYEYAQTLAAQGHMKAANEQLALAAERDPSNSLYHYEQGMNWFYLNDLQQAEQSFLKALALNPDDLNSGYQLGYLYAVKKDVEKAEKHLNHVWQTRRNHPKVEASRQLIELIKKGAAGKLPAKTDPHKYHLARSQSLYQSGEYGLALVEIQTAARLKPRDKPTQQVMVALASLLLRLKLTEKTVRHLLSFTQDDKILQAKGYQELGDIAVMRGKLNEAREFYRKSQSLGDPDGLAKISLAELPPRPQETQRVLDSSDMRINPAETLNLKGEVFANYGMYQRALALYSMALRQNPGHLMSKLNMAMAHYKKGEPRKTITLLERILVNHPNHEHILSHRALLAKAYARKGDRESAITNLKIIQKIKPSLLRVLRNDPVFKILKDHELFNP